MRKRAGRSKVLLLLAGILAMVGPTLWPLGEVAAADKIALGVCQSTAPGPAKFAQALWKGAEIVVEEVNAKGGIGGRQLELVPMDIGKNDPSQARLSFQKAFTFDKVVSFLCWASNVMLQNGPFIDEHKVLAFTMSQSTRVPKEAQFIQQLEAVTTLQARAVAEYIKKNRPDIKAVGVLYVDYEYGYDLLKACEAEFGKRGIPVVTKTAHPISPPDLRAQFTKMMEAKPGAIYLGSIGGGEVALGIRTARELGFEGYLMTHGAGDTPDVYNLTLAERDFIFISHAVQDRAPAEVKNRTPIYGGYVGAGYDFAWINRMLMQELLKEGRPITGQNLRDKLRAIRNVKTPVNDFEFLPDGDVVRTMAVFKVKGGKRELIRILNPADLKE